MAHFSVKRAEGAWYVVHERTEGRGEDKRVKKKCPPSLGFGTMGWGGCERTYIYKVKARYNLSFSPAQAVSPCPHYSLTDEHQRPASVVHVPDLVRVIVSFFPRDGHAREMQHFEDVHGAELVRQTQTKRVEVRQGSFGLHGEQLAIFGLEKREHVVTGKVRTITQQSLGVVEDGVQHDVAEVRGAHLVNLGIPGRDRVGRGWGMCKEVVFFFCSVTEWMELTAQT